MKKKTLSLLMFLMGICASALAGIPEGYYSSADSKKYIDLKKALCDIIKEHATFSYSSLWEYYPFTYYNISNPNQVLDMYSDDVNYFSNTSTLNKEHTVPKSWWGGSTAMGPGCDIFNVIPSEQKANSAKSNYPLGVVAGQASFDNGVTKVGKSGVEGYDDTVFEPKDGYKGDFARIYFYVATCYPDLLWDDNNAKAMTNSTELTLQSWIIPMLLQWSTNDPVDEAEIQRNEDIYKQQGNRNPFIDYPALADYIWGSKIDDSFVLSDHKANEGESKDFQTILPTFSIDYGTESEPKTVNDNSIVTIKGGTTTSTLFTRINGGEWEQTDWTTGYSSGGTEYQIAAAKEYTVSGNTLIEAYCTKDGYLNSDTIAAYYTGVDFSKEYLLYEAFDELSSGSNTSTTGPSSTAWTGNTNFPTATLVYPAGNTVKLGGSSKSGSLTSRTLATEGGTLEVEFDVKGWSKVEGNISVSITGAETQTVKYTATITDSFEHIKLTFTNVSANPSFTIGTTAKRAFLDNITVKEVAADGISLPADGNKSVGATYNLAGQKVDSQYKGIKIANGRKYISK